jgi:cyclic-di-AMP phosphodiesterase PgpH
MSLHQEAHPEAQQRLRRLVQNSFLWVTAIVLTLVITLIVSFHLVTAQQVTVAAGDTATVAIEAPHTLTYVSEVLTQQNREQAAAAVEDVYHSRDLSIGRAQSNRARAVFNFIDVVRADTFSDTTTKVHYLQAIEGLIIEPAVAEDLLTLPASEYATAKAAVLRIIEETMRGAIRESEGAAARTDMRSVAEARRDARAMIGFDWSTAQERVVTNIAPQFIVANTFRDEETTAQRRADVMAAIEPETRAVTRGQPIIQVGQEINAADVEMLDKLGLLQRENNWRRLLSAFLISLMSVMIVTLYWQQFHSEAPEANRYLIILAILLVLFVLGARIMVPGRTPLTFLFPAAALSMLLAVILEVRLSLLVTVIVAALAGYMAQDGLDLAVYTAVGGLLAALTLRDTQRINALFRAGLIAAAGNVAVILTFRLPQEIPPLELVQQLLFALTNGLISASLTLAGFFIIGALFGVMTTVQLQDLSRLDHPLLQELLRRAPGSYHHSIMVANLAEQAAERIRANSSLVRVGAFYHDVGKMNRPPFFIENQEGANPHDSLDPFSSARIIIGHVADGLQLARRYRLPGRIRDFIAEHHGNRVLKTFYQKARELADDADEVDIERFRYKGPRPRSRETGIVQLADSIEATSSALRPNTEAAIEKLVVTIIEEHLKEGQLDRSGLTLGDINRLRESFIETLKGRFHVRVRYPGNDQMISESGELVEPGAGLIEEDGRVTAAADVPDVVAVQREMEQARAAGEKSDGPVRRGDSNGDGRPTS